MASPKDAPDAAPDFAPGPVADAWDAGDMGCGELVVELKFKLDALSPGDLFHLVARDPGVVEDLPAWCRMTRHTLRHAARPHYYIVRRTG